MGFLSKIFAEPPKKYGQTPTTLYDILKDRLEKGNEKNRRWFQYSTRGLFGFTVISSLYLNTLVRRSFLVYEGFIVSSVASAFLSSMSNVCCQTVFFEQSLLSGYIRCKTCAVTRGATLQAVTGCLLPGFVCLFATLILADRFQSRAMPNLEIAPKKEIFQYFKKSLRNVFKPSKYLLAMHILAGGICAMKEYQITEGLIKTLTPEDIEILWKTLHSDLYNAT